MAEGHASDYELIPHREILDLKAQVEELKKQRGIVEQGAEAEIIISNKELYDAMNRLTEGINQMLKLFKKAGEDMSKYDDNEPYIRKLKPIEEKVNELTEQNKKIARGILAIADSIKDQLNKLSDSFEDQMNELKESTHPHTAPVTQGMGGYLDPMGGGMAPSAPPGSIPPPPIPPPSPPK